MTKRDLSAVLHHSTRWIEKQMSLGMPHHKWGGRNAKALFRRSEVEAWLEEAT